MTETTWFLALGAGVWITVLILVARSEAKNVRKTPEERERDRK